MSATTVVVEPPPPAPPAAAATAATAATDATPAPAPASPTKQPQLNGVRSPTAATPEANGHAATAPSEDVEMAAAGSEAAPDATANGSAVAIKAEPSSAADAAPTGEPSATPMEVDDPLVESNEAVPSEPEATKIQSRAPQDDARALALAARRLELQIAFVENARKKIADESHPDFVTRMVPIDAERERLLALATSQESYWTHCTSVIFAYECEEASSEFMMNCDKLRHEMLDEIHQEMEILNDQRKGSSSARKTTRKTRSARSKAGAGSGGSGAGSDEKVFALDAAYTAQKAKKRVGNVFTHLENKLAQSEVDHDLRELHTSMDAVSKKRRMDATESPFVAKYHRANFLYRDAIFQEGDEIFVRNLMNGSEYIAVICSITSTELFVLSEKGKYFRLVFMDLRQGRVVVSAPSAEQTAALNEREALRI